MIITILISISLLIGGIFFIVKDTKVKQSQSERNYILVEVQSKDGYPFPLALPKGKTAKEVVVLFKPDYHHIFRKANGRWIEINEQQQINSDIQMKVT